MENFSVPGVRLRIGLLAKLGCFKSAVDNFLVFITKISLASGPIRSLTSWYAKVLHSLSLKNCLGWREYHFALASANAREIESVLIRVKLIGTLCR